MRHPVAGGHLGQALRLLGKCWRKNTRDPHHVLNWDVWTALGLPRSSTTIDADIRQGVPEDRLADYAQCLGLSSVALLSPDTDIRAALGTSRPARTTAVHGPSIGLSPQFLEEYAACNSQTYLEKLFALLGGVYRLHYVLPIADFVNRCALWVRRVEEQHLSGRGMFVRFGLENYFTHTISRWHNNLHLTYLCDTGKELGHVLLVDPLRHNLVARRTPFWLKGQGVTDSGLADNMPVNFTLRMEKLPTPDSVTPGAWWDRECEDLRQRPSSFPGDTDYEALRDEVLRPDALP